MWCVVPDAAEADAAFGLGRAIVLDPWPGQRAALGEAVARVHADDDDTVRVLAAGAAPSGYGRAPDGIRIPASGAWRAARRIGSRSLGHAVVRPGSGLVMRGRAMRALAEAGWFEAKELTVDELRTVAGSVEFDALPRDRRGEIALPAGTIRRMSVTVVVPAHNEAACIGDTVRSLMSQTRAADRVLVIDDGSSDETGDIARHLGADVLRTHGTGSKGAAINLGMDSITTDVVILVDADTSLDSQAIEHLMRDMERGADATHGAVFPSVERGLWARGRLIEYATARRFYKGVQRRLGQLMVLSGCVLAVRTDVLRDVGGFQPRTMVEDLDLTWTLHQHGVRVEYTPNAIAYPIEPVTWAQYKGQMRRWARGFFQSVEVHARSLHRTPSLALIILGSIWDIITAPILMVILLVLWTMHIAPPHAVQALVLWQIAWTGIAVLMASTVIGLRRAVLGAPGYLVMCTCATYFYVEAFATEWLLRRRLETWVKGH